ncbi:MAG TPA: cytochrome P450 [Stackebrandtia sp.]|jgi:cytochrome P450|uniref:cytochrome P450 n=1 Tax=Stackebrandtia sp. TaxID=2023065 RepID=UPI002D562D94|nr:cytochrome P450 [Stackebrandtia sp.]HZE41793.1 cytochrome P450 [Stackebrandtia sp.]
MTEAPIPHGIPTERDAGPFDSPRAVTRLRESRPISRLVFPDGHDGYVITGYELARAFISDTRFSSRMDTYQLHMPVDADGMATIPPMPTQPGMFIKMDPPDHSRLRTLVTGTFTVKRMKQWETFIGEAVERQLDHLAGLQPPADLVKEFALPIPSLVISELLGVPYADREFFQDITTKAMTLDIDVNERIAAYTAGTEYLTELVRRKHTEPGDDLLSDLLRRGDATDEEVVGMGQLLLGAGHETTANMLALGTFALLEHPEQLAALRAEPELMPGAVEELLRYLTIADIGVRVAASDVEFGGERIAEGTCVAVSMLAANRDPARFDDPDTLDVRRNARGHLSFGHGIHQCLGQQLARIEVRAGIGGLLRRFGDLRLAVPAAKIPLRTNMQVYGVHELPVAWG